MPLSSIKNIKELQIKDSPSIHLLMHHWSIQKWSWTVWGAEMSTTCLVMLSQKGSHHDERQCRPLCKIK